MLVFDTEATDLLAPEAAPIEQQPHLLELACIKLDDKTLKEVARLEFLVNPRVPIPEKCTEITGITAATVKGKPPFAAYFGALADFWLGERYVVAHNLSYDNGVLYWELKRLGKVTAFPWCPGTICTVEKSLPLHGHRMKLGDLHLELTKKEHKDAHRAISDVEALVRIVRIMDKKGMLR